MITRTNSFNTPPFGNGDAAWFVRVRNSTQNLNIPGQIHDSKALKNVQISCALTDTSKKFQNVENKNI